MTSIKYQNLFSKLEIFIFTIRSTSTDRERETEEREGDRGERGERGTVGEINNEMIS